MLASYFPLKTNLYKSSSFNFQPLKISVWITQNLFWASLISFSNELLLSKIWVFRRNAAAQNVTKAIMTSRKIFGYIFLIIAILLTVAIVGQLYQLFAAILGIFKIFSGELDSYQVGLLIGTFITWLFLIALTIFLWIIGRRWIKKSK